MALALLAAGCVTPAVQPPQGGAPLPPLPAAVPAFGNAVKVGEQGNEPVVRVGPDGTVYIGALHHVYVSTGQGASFREVDFKGMIPVYASDSALSVAPSGRAYVAFDWPYAGSTAVCASSDRGATWDCNPTAVPGATDRMWILAPTDRDVYLITGQTLDRPTFAVSHDEGRTWTTTSFQPDVESQGADLAWDPVRQLIVEAATAADGGGWGVRTFTPDGAFQGFAPMGLPAPLGDATVAVDAAGTWWAVACAEGEPGSNCKPGVARSEDAGATWNVTAIPSEANTFLLRFIAAGAADRVVTGWYETAAGSADDGSADWRFVAAQTADGQHWTPTLLTPEPVHHGAMCSSLSCLGEARFAGDFIGLALDGQGQAHAAWVRQTGPKIPPTTQLSLQPWEQVEYARTNAPAAPVSAGDRAARSADLVLNNRFK
jgi:hypothetical protein